jgi:hypothetical protein
MLTIDRFEGSNLADSIARYEEIERLLKEHFGGLRIRFGCAMSALKTATPVKHVRARRE